MNWVICRHWATIESCACSLCEKRRMFGSSGFFDCTHNFECMYHVVTRRGSIPWKCWGFSRGLASYLYILDLFQKRVSWMLISDEAHATSHRQFQSMTSQVKKKTKSQDDKSAKPDLKPWLVRRFCWAWGSSVVWHVLDRLDLEAIGILKLRLGLTRLWKLCAYVLHTDLSKGESEEL